MFFVGSCNNAGVNSSFLKNKIKNLQLFEYSLVIVGVFVQLLKKRHYEKVYSYSYQHYSPG